MAKNNIAKISKEKALEKEYACILLLSESPQIRNNIPISQPTLNKYLNKGIIREVEGTSHFPLRERCYELNDISQFEVSKIKIRNKIILLKKNKQKISHLRRLLK